MFIYKKHHLVKIDNKLLAVTWYTIRTLQSPNNGHQKLHDYSESPASMIIRGTSETSLPGQLRQNLLSKNTAFGETVRYIEARSDDTL